MTLRHGSDMSVCGIVECESRVGVCVPGDIHRVDADLELCVCAECGQGWIRDVDAWTKVKESFERLDAANQRLDDAINSLKASLQKIVDELQSATFPK